MPLSELLIRGANASVVVFVVSSTLPVGLGLTVPQIVAPLRNGRLVALSLLANFVVAPVAAIGLATVLGLEEPLAIGLLLVAVAGALRFSSSWPIWQGPTGDSRLCLLLCFWSSRWAPCLSSFRCCFLACPLIPPTSPDR